MLKGKPCSACRALQRRAEELAALGAVFSAAHLSEQIAQCSCHAALTLLDQQESK